MADPEKNMAETPLNPEPQHAPEMSQLEQLVDQRRGLTRVLRRTPTEDARNQFNQTETQINQLMAEAQNNGALNGLDRIVDDIYSKINQLSHPGDKWGELERQRAIWGEERFRQIERRFAADFSPEELASYGGAQRIYIERSLEDIEKIIQGEDISSVENSVLWTKESFEQRRVEDEILNRENNNRLKKDFKELDREATIEQFVRLYNLQNSGEQVLRYIQAQYTIDHPDQVPADQRDYLVDQAKGTVSNTPENLQKIGREAFSNYQNQVQLNSYIEARNKLSSPGNLPNAELAEAQRIIDATPKAQQKIAEEIAEIRGGRVPNNVEDFIEAILGREKLKLLNLATKVVIVEETVSKDERNYIVLDEAYKTVENMFPEALRNGALMGLQYDMNNLYLDYRDKIRGGRVHGGDKKDLKEIEKSMMDMESEYWNRKSYKFSKQFREQWEGLRSFYVHRAFERLFDALDNPGEWAGVLATEREWDQKYASGEIDEVTYLENTIFGKERAAQHRLRERYNLRGQELNLQLQQGQITQEDFDILERAEGEAYLVGLRNLQERRFITLEWTPRDAEAETIRTEYEAENRALEKESFWDRQLGMVILTGRNEAELRKGVKNFISAATGSAATFDANRYIEDGTRLGQEVIRVGRMIGMDNDEIMELAPFAEGALFINVARYFSTIAFTNEWHQMSLMYSKNFRSKTSAISKEYDGKVIYAADVLDTEDEYKAYGRPATHDLEKPETLAEKSSKNNQAAGILRATWKRRLEVRTALTNLKDKDQILTEHFARLGPAITALGFDVNNIPEGKYDAIFQLPAYHAKIREIKAKLKTFTEKFDQDPNSIQPADTILIAEEKSFLALDRIRPYKKNKDLVIMDQTHDKFRALYDEGETAFQAEIVKLKEEADYPDQEALLIQKLNQAQIDLATGQTQLPKDELVKQLFGLLNDKEVKILKNYLLEKYRAEDYEEDKWTEVEEEFIKKAIPEWEDAKQAVDLAIKTRDVFYITTEQANGSVRARMQLPKTDPERGELLYINDVTRAVKFIRERAILNLPEDRAKAITELNNNGQGFRYVEIADKLEYINISEQVKKQADVDKVKSETDHTRKITKGLEDTYKKNADEAEKLIQLTEEEKPLGPYVQAVENAIQKGLSRLKEKGSDIKVTDIDAGINAALGNLKDTSDEAQARLAKHLQSVHGNETGVRSTGSDPNIKDFNDIVSREDADPQYNFNALDDQKYRSLLLSEENRAAAYNSNHPYYNTLPARTLRTLDREGRELRKIPDDPTKEKVLAYRVMERQRRFYFAVDSVKAFAIFDDPEYSLWGKGEWNSDVVIGLLNSPFTGRRGIEQRVWAKADPGFINRGRGFLKYLDPNVRALDHSVGVRGLRGLTASYEGYDPTLKDAFAGAMDEYAADRYLDKLKEADLVRPVLVGGQVGQDPNFPGLFKKPLSTPGRVNSDYNAFKEGERGPGGHKDVPPIIRISEKWEDQMRGGDYEAAIKGTTEVWERIVIYGNSLKYLGNVSHTPLAAKFSGDTAVKRMAYWAIAHPEAWDTYNVNTEIARIILMPLKQNIGYGNSQINYFGQNATLLSELLRREILVK